MSRIKVALVGAAGKMGTRTSRNLLKETEKFEVKCVESGDVGLKVLKERGLEPYTAEQAVPGADVVVLAVPDSLILKISESITPLMSPGSGMVILDPAAAVAGELIMKDDCTYAVAHPCHPSYFKDQDTLEARNDYFGGEGGKQDIVMAKVQGDDDVFELCREVSKHMYAPVENAFVLDSVQQIAFLEPTLVETLGATCLYAMAETVNEAVKRGIPREAANSFLSGHIYNLSANFLGYMGNVPVSDACMVAMDIGRRLVLRDDWKKIWEDENLKKVISTMLHPENPQI
ncbi:MAG: phosphogluconate dehydrogenase C-terminal domain-containing protein [Fastidiosipilaceae bacterium]